MNFRKFWDTHSLLIILFAAFLISWFVQAGAQWMEFVLEQTSHNEPATWSDFKWFFISRTAENWQSEFLQLGAFVLLSKFFKYIGSPQSRDGDDEMKDMLQDLQFDVKLLKDRLEES